MTRPSGEEVCNDKEQELIDLEKYAEDVRRVYMIRSSI